MYRCINEQIPVTKSVVIPKNRANGRMLNVSVTCHFEAQRERPCARSRAAKMKRARASPGRPATQPDAPSTAEVRAKRAHGNHLYQKGAFPLIMRLDQLSRHTQLRGSGLFSHCQIYVTHHARTTFTRQGNATECDTFTVISQEQTVRCATSVYVQSLLFTDGLLHENNLHQRKPSGCSARGERAAFKTV